MIATIILMAASAFGQAGKNKVSISDIVRDLKDGPLSLAFYLSNEGLRDANDKIRGVDSFLESTFTYDHDENNDYRLYTYSGITFNGNAGKDHGLDFVEVRHRWKSILNQKDHGVNLNSEHRIGKMTSGRWRNQNDQDNYIQHRFSVSRKFTEDFSLEFLTRVQLYGSVSRQPEKTKNLYRFYLVPSLTLTDRFSVSALTMYSNADRRGGTDSGYLLVEPAITYKLSRDVSAGLYADLLPFKSNDGQVVAEDILGKSTIGVNVSASIF